MKVKNNWLKNTAQVHFTMWKQGKAGTIITAKLESNDVEISDDKIILRNLKSCDVGHFVYDKSRPTAGTQDSEYDIQLDVYIGGDRKEAWHVPYSQLLKVRHDKNQTFQFVFASTFKIINSQYIQ